jgi:hypothetical protein
MCMCMCMCSCMCMCMCMCMCTCMCSCMCMCMCMCVRVRHTSLHHAILRGLTCSLQLLQLGHELLTEPQLGCHLCLHVVIATGASIVLHSPRAATPRAHLPKLPLICRAGEGHHNGGVASCMTSVQAYKGTRMELEEHHDCMRGAGGGTQSHHDMVTHRQRWHCGVACAGGPWGSTGSAVPPCDRWQGATCCPRCS